MRKQDIKEHECYIYKKYVVLITDNSPNKYVVVDIIYDNGNTNVCCTLSRRDIKPPSNHEETRMIKSYTRRALVKLQEQPTLDDPVGLERPIYETTYVRQ